jgi:rubrerythrin
MTLRGSRTEQSLVAAFARESQANRRFLYFAQRADSEGLAEIASVFRSTAEGETGHAHGHLEYLEAAADPLTGLPIGDTIANLRAAIAGEDADARKHYPEMARAAREEGFVQIAEWFESLAGAQQSHADRFRKALDRLLTWRAGVRADDPSG